VRGVFTAATIGAGVTGLDLELEGIFGAGDMEALVRDGFTVDAFGLEVDGGFFFGEDGEAFIIQGDDIEVILPASDTEGVTFGEVFASEVEGIDLGDCLEELHGGRSSLLFQRQLEDNHHEGRVKG